MLVALPAPPRRDTLMRMERLPNFIAGEFVDPAGAGWLDNIEPATGRSYGQVADADARDVHAAVQAAHAAFPAWSATPAEQRCAQLMRIADAIETRLEDFARAESRDTGKPLALARSLDIPRAARNFRFFATAVLHARSELHVTDHAALNYTLRRPRGVAGVISPWNLPLYLLSWKVAPALAWGNTVVAKPSEVTPMTAHMLAQVARDVGLPPGVLNIVHGRGAVAGAALVAHPLAGTISFTGSTRTGAEIARVAAPLFKKFALEMGGKNPTVVFADADLAEAVAHSVRAAFTNQGQVCLCGSRVLVERPIFDEFAQRFVHAAGRLRVGDPFDPASDQGAIVSQAQLQKTMQYVELARADGGQILGGGRRPANLPDRCRDGFFYEPTVIAGLTPDCRVNREEIFGPVATLTPFADEREALSIANGTDYGLSASIWTQDVRRAHRFADALEAGTVWINCWLLRDLRVPFGGMKQSGVGREGGDEAMRFFTEPKNVALRLA